MIATERGSSVPWIGGPYKLVSLREILLMPRPTDAEGYPMDEVLFGRFANLLWILGALDGVRGLSEKDIIGFGVMIRLAADDMDRWGLNIAARATRDLAEMVDGDAVVTNLPVQVAMVRNALGIELETRVFVQVPTDKARYYREPLKDWEEVTDRFPETISDIEEASRTHALGFYTATVFHSIQVVEHGLLALGTFMKLEDPRSGFTAVANALQRIKDAKYPNLTDFERKHFAFFEQMHGSVHAMKDSWRNKVTHAQGKIVLMTSDFGPKVAEEIYFATRGFMRRLATDMPKKGGLFQ